MKILMTAAGILGALLFITASILGGLQIDGYSFASQYISESYANGLPNTTYLRFMYMASGIMIALFAFSAPTAMPKVPGLKTGFTVFGIFYGLGTLMTGFFPCDIGCNPDPDTASISQFIHNTIGFLVYAIIPICVAAIGFASKNEEGIEKFSKTSMTCGLLAAIFVAFLFGNPEGPFIGIFQRIIEGSILFWVIYTALSLMRYR